MSKLFLDNPLPEILRVCERSGVGYAIGFARNGVLERKIANLLERARSSVHSNPTEGALV